MDSNRERSIGGGAVLVAVLLVASAVLAVPAAAQPSIAVFGGSLDRTATTVGEPVNISVKLRNSGSGGATLVEVDANGIPHVERRVTVPGETTQVTEIPLQFEERGSYEITVNGRAAGTLEVVSARTKGVTDRGNGRTVSVVGVTDGTDGTVTAAIPPAENQSIYLDRITLRSTESEFNAGFESYLPVSAAPIVTPEGEGTNLLGAFRTGGQLGVETNSFRMVVDRAILLERDLGPADLTVYQQDGTQYVPLATELVNETGDRYVYEVTVDGGTRFVVGTLEPRFETRNTILNTGSTDEGARVSVTATVANVGGLGGDYRGDLRVDGTVVAADNVTVGAGESQTMRLEHVITQPGEHEVSFGEQPVGSVEVSPSGDPVGDDGEPASGDGFGGGALGPGLVGPLGIEGFGPQSLAVGMSVAVFGGVVALALRE